MNNQNQNWQNDGSWYDGEHNPYRREADPNGSPNGQPDGPYNGRYNSYDDGGPMAAVSLVCGILALLSFLFGVGIIFAALGITFALLSRKQVLSRRARQGLATSSVALALFASVCLLTVVTLRQNGMWDVISEAAESLDPSDEASVEQFESTVQNELLKRLYGEDTARAITGSGSGTDSTESDASDTPDAESAAPESGNDSSAGSGQPGGGASSGSNSPLPEPVPGGSLSTI